MGITDQVVRTVPAEEADAFDEIDAIIGCSRSGSLSREVALQAIGRIVRQATDAVRAETYQKPWG